jgi:hypothetical protein
MTVRTGPPENRCSIPGRCRGFSFLQSVVQTGSGAPAASYPSSTKVLSLGSKLPGREV